MCQMDKERRIRKDRSAKQGLMGAVRQGYERVLVGLMMGGDMIGHDAPCNARPGLAVIGN